MPVKPPVIAGKYTLLRKLGAGGMAEVYLAKQDSGGNFEKLVVIKRILPHLASGQSNEEFVRMFLDEARLASDLRHPNVVTVIDIGKTSDTHFIVMEFLHGQDVRKVQRKNASWEEMVPLGHACQMAIDAAAGLHYAHTKTDLHGRALSIVHRDVSPQNIIVTYEGGTKIVDFGIAKAATQTTHTAAGVLKGKYTYMSPEQAAGEIVDARTDQFALGIVLWELLTMRRLFKRESETSTLEAIIAGVIPRPTRFRPDIPRSIEDVVMRSLERNKRDRYADCEAMALALEDACAAAGVVHSRSRLAQYMRRLFADTLAEEATLGLVNPDGSISRNLTPFTLPPLEKNRGADKMEQPRGAREAREPEPPRVEPTTADRRGARSHEESGPRKASREDDRAPAREPRREVRDVEHDADQDAGQDAEQDAEQDTDPTVANRPQRAQEHPRREDREARRGSPPARASGAQRPGPRRSGDVVPPRLLAAGVAIAAGMAVVGAWAAYGAWLGSGTGTLIIRTKPVGAAVFVDGQETGERSPALLKDVEVGVPHKVRAVLGAQPPIEEIVTVPRRGAIEELTLTFPP